MINKYLQKLILENRKITVDKIDSETGDKLEVNEIEPGIYKLPYSEIQFKIVQLNNDIYEVYVINDGEDNFVGDVYSMNDGTWLGKSEDLEVPGKTYMDSAVGLLTVSGLI